MPAHRVTVLYDCQPCGPAKTRSMASAGTAVAKPNAFRYLDQIAVGSYKSRPPRVPRRKRRASGVTGRASAWRWPGGSLALPAPAPPSRGASHPSPGGGRGRRLGQLRPHRLTLPAGLKHAACPRCGGIAAVRQKAIATAEIAGLLPWVPRYPPRGRSANSSQPFAGKVLTPSQGRPGTAPTTPRESRARR